jgi:hypothetical protein
VIERQLRQKSSGCAWLADQFCESGKLSRFKPFPFEDDSARILEPQRGIAATQKERPDLQLSAWICERLRENEKRSQKQNEQIP